MHKPSLLVSGISGQLGRSVIEQLSGRPGYRLIGTTRTPTSRLDFATHGIDVRYADFDDPSCLAKAFDGVDRILLISTSAEYCGPRRVEQHRHAIAAARDAGARQLIYTSLLNADASPLGPIASDHAATEAMLQASGLRYLALRNCFYMEMLLSPLQRAVATGEWISAAEQGRVAYITRENCATAAAAALSLSLEDSQILNITGPVSLSGEELVAIANTVLGTSIRFRAVTKEEAASHMTATGIPAPMAKLLAYIDWCVSQQAMSPASDDFRLLTGYRASSVEDFLITHRESLLRFLRHR